MSARLQVVPVRPIPDPAHWMWSGADPAQAPAPRVLCAEMSRRLEQLNAAVRRLRAWGIPIERQLIAGTWPAEDRPVVRIRREPDRSIAPLLDACPPRAFVPLADGMLFTAMLDGVAVMWEER